MFQDLSTAAQIGHPSKQMFNIIAQCSGTNHGYDERSTAKANVL